MLSWFISLLSVIMPGGRVKCSFIFPSSRNFLTKLECKLREGQTANYTALDKIETCISILGIRLLSWYFLVGAGFRNCCVCDNILMIFPDIFTLFFFFLTRIACFFKMIRRNETKHKRIRSSQM